MITNETIAHDLAIIYLSNRYGVSLKDSFSIHDGNSMGFLKTEHFPDATKLKYKMVGTGEKGFLGVERKVKVEDGYMVDDLFIEIMGNYRVAYQRFLALLESE